MKQRYRCTHCEGEILLDLDSLKTSVDVLRVTCNCGLDWCITGDGQIYKPKDGEMISELLKPLLLLSPTMFFVADELVKTAKLNRWKHFEKIVKRNIAKIQNNTLLVNFLIANSLYI